MDDTNKMKMSIIFTHKNGWILDHEDYINKIYENVRCNDIVSSFKFKSGFFDINTRFLRKNQRFSVEEDGEKQTKVSVSSKGKKRKKSTLFADALVEQNKIVETLSFEILDSAKDCHTFVNNSVRNNNEEARLEATKFYENEKSTNLSFFGQNSENFSVTCDFGNKNYLLPKYSSFHCNDVCDISKKLSAKGKFDIILLDPPWWNKAVRRKKNMFDGNGYSMIYNDKLAEIPLQTLLDPNGLIFIWCTNAPSHFRSLIEDIFPSWGVILKSKWYWLKVAKNGETICDFNNFGKQPYELLLIAANKFNDIEIPDCKILISVPSSVHSHKPPLVEILEELFSEHKKCLEIFARYLLPGWTSYGLEVLKFQNTSLYDSQNMG